MALTGFFTLLALILDQASKLLVINFVDKYDSIYIIDGFLSISNIRNKGIAFGMFQNGGTYLVSLILIMIFCVFLLSLRYSKYSAWLSFCFGSIIGGGLGNIIDRAVWGSVIDFISVDGFAVFNIGDSFIVVGAAVLCLYILLIERKNDKIDKLASMVQNNSARMLEKELNSQFRNKSFRLFDLFENDLLNINNQSIPTFFGTVPDSSVVSEKTEYMRILDFKYPFEINSDELNLEDYILNKIEFIHISPSNPLKVLRFFSFDKLQDFDEFNKKYFMNIRKIGNHDTIFRIIYFERVLLEPNSTDNNEIIINYDKA